MFGNVKRWMVVLGAAAMIGAGTLGTIAFAQTTPPATPGTQSTTQKTDYRQVFLGKLATLLGVDQQKLQDSMKQAGKDTVDQAVKNGDLTQAQGDQAKTRIDQGQLGFVGHFGAPNGKWHGRGAWGFRGRRGAFGQTTFKAAADKLGMTVQALQTELRSGKSLSDVAKEKGVSDQDLQSAMVAAAKTQLDQAVKNGKMTQNQENSILQRIQQGNWLNHKGKPAPKQ